MHLYGSHLRSKETEFNYCSEGRCLKYDNNRKISQACYYFSETVRNKLTVHEKLVDLDKNSRQRRNKNVMFTVYNCSQLNSLDSHISSQTQPLILKSGQQVK